MAEQQDDGRGTSAQVVTPGATDGAGGDLSGGRPAPRLVVAPDMSRA